ncbi:uncharacterized protein LOC129951256 [Eupeodes corollae]|uniref:uncharacterized protein LOC129951256 n=1 Tax=Eupeodes corollae TaxID=290404 RepID=UPI0024901F50|nr:uncharacterized protein LOC129951256 [Eupeodes corollae]
MVRVEGCCCCNLRTGGLVIGWLCIVFLVLGFIGTIKDIIDDTSINRDSLNRNSDERQRHRIFTLIVTSIDILVNGLLINGIIKKKQNRLLPWLIVRGISLLIIIPAGLFVIFLTKLLTSPGIFVVTAIFGVFIGLWIWAWIVIFSLYHEIRDAKLRPPQHMSMATPHYQNQTNYQGQ